MKDHIDEQEKSLKRPTTAQRQSVKVYLFLSFSTYFICFFIKDEKPRVRFEREKSVEQILREHDAAYEEKLAAQKT